MDTNDEQIDELSDDEPSTYRERFDEFVEDLAWTFDAMTLNLQCVLDQALHAFEHLLPSRVEDYMWSTKYGDIRWQFCQDTWAKVFDHLEEDEPEGDAHGL